ncbi:MAG: hydrogenase maturation protease [Phycisphaerae bacterium]|nr:hydrogenase maturation protease [Phycisphaerae bacterium]
MNDKKILLIGYGNPGRLDDGLGPAFAKAAEEFAPPDLTVDSDYQLNVEDADAAAKHEIVIFVDADTAGVEPFWMKEIHAGPPQVSFSSHSMSPEGVLALARDLFHAAPKAYLLGIRGYEFNEFGQSLSSGAEANLKEAIDFWRDACQKGLANHLREIRPEGASPRPGLNHNEDDPCKTENT